MKIFNVKITSPIYGCYWKLFNAESIENIKQYVSENKLGKVVDWEIPTITVC